MNKKNENDNKNINLGEFNINSVQELNYKYERYMGMWVSKGKRILYFNNGDIYKGDIKNNKKERKAIYYFNHVD